MSDPNDPRNQATTVRPPYPPQQPPPRQHYPAQPPYAPHGQPYPGQYPYPYYAPLQPRITHPGAVIALGAAGGALAYIFIGVPVGLLFDLAAFNISPNLVLRALTTPLPKIGVPSILFFLIYSALLGALVGAMRLGIRNAAAMVAAGLAFGLLVRTGLGLGVIGPLLSGQVRLNFPLLGWAKTLLANGLWGLGVGAFLALTTTR
ncbi:MAG: hypothetical protein F9K44_07690 [Hyphomicrobiaceae bacterium]|nr:MAG: hypothetical protein F9K44_07690 [Hyphomicrobiaceae bacterium]